MNLKLAMPRNVIVTFAVIFVVAELFLMFLSLHFGLPIDTPQLAPMRRALLVVIVFFAGLYAFMRAARHPASNAKYRRWLETSPWTDRLPLPLGPVVFGVADFVVLSIAAALGTWRAGIHPTLPFIIAFIAYALAALEPLVKADREATVLGLLVVAPILLLVAPHPWLLLATASSLYAIALLGVRASLRAFPWESNRAAPGTASLGWPFATLAPVRPELVVRPGIGVLIGAILAWWAFAVMVRFGPPQDRSAIILVSLILGGICALIRTARYFDGHFPPLTMWARIRTGRIIIPGYDQIFVAPLLTLASAVLIPWSLLTLGFRHDLALALSFATPLTLALELGPSYLDWDTTGAHRIGFVKSGR